MPVLYEVRVTVDAELAQQFEDYMQGHHIGDVLATGYFAGASFVREGENRYVTVYEADTRADLDKYIEKESPRLKEDFAVHFSSGVEVTRNITETD